MPRADCGRNHGARTTRRSAGTRSRRDGSTGAGLLLRYAAQDTFLQPKIQTAAPYRSALSAHQAHLCWGAQLCKTDRCPLVVPKSPAFRDRFCAACREGAIIVPCCRIRVLDSSLPAPKNSRAEGMWNLEGRTDPPFWPPHRVINQTADTCGLRLIVLRDETSALLQGLAPLPAEFGSEIAFLVRRTLVPTPGMPAQLIHALRGMGQSGTLANNANVSGADPSSSLLRFGSSGDD